MERLTKRLNNGKELCIDVCGEQCVDGYTWCPKCKPFSDVMKKLAEYEDAEEQGLILRLAAPLDDVESFEIADKGIWMKIPCRKGDTVYEIDGITWKGYDWKYKSYENAFVKETVFRLEMLSEIGKTVFLTKEEAEQALAKMKEV